MSAQFAPRWWKLIALALAGAVLLAACGQKGPLYLPGKAPQKAAQSHDRQR